MRQQLCVQLCRTELDSSLPHEGLHVGVDEKSSSLICPYVPAQGRGFISLLLFLKQDDVDDMVQVLCI